jgi:SpoVK/Ycf46/Vps4 family AAA+-type ATPase
VLHLGGRDARALHWAAARLAQAGGLSLLLLDLAPLAASLGLEAALELAEREGALQPAAVAVLDAQTLKPEDAERLRARLGDRPAVRAPLLILLSDGRFHWQGLTIALPDPDYAARRELWREGLTTLDRPGQPELGTDTLAGLADRFRLTARQIEDAVQTARAAAIWRDPHNPHVGQVDLFAAARTHSTPILSNLARKITPHYGWDDIVLPADTVAQMREICSYVEHRHTVYEQWGFGRKLALGLGLMALFAGESGTGKTMAAEIIAGALGLDLYKIDLSNVISKYIGETEKNLNRIFAEAETSNAILFFDEADALFGKRSEVKDAHDRYANIETAYLLQKMEEYDGVVILATNLKMNIDEAFLRRMHFVVDFPVPSEDDRRRIWQGALPAQLPLAPDVDFDFLARKFKVTGGNIRNITLLAAFLAAGDGQVVRMEHMVQATRREFQKIGRMVTPSDFERFYPLFETQAD